MTPEAARLNKPAFHDGAWRTLFLADMISTATPRQTGCPAFKDVFREAHPAPLRFHSACRTPVIAGGNARRCRDGRISSR
jgi:hypothetical protein